MMFRVLLSSSLILGILGCKPRVFNSTETRSSSLQTLPDVQVFHWTNDSRALSDTKGYLLSQTNPAHSKNEALRSGRFPPYTVVGHGLYLAADPVQSHSYGNILVSVRLKAASVPVLIDFDQDEVRPFVVDKSVPTIVYKWTSGVFLAGEGAAVVRDASALDISSTKVTAVGKGKTYCEHAPLAIDDSMEKLVAGYGDLLASAAPLSDDGIGYGEKLFTEKKFNEFGIAAAAWGEAASLPQNLEQSAKAFLAKQENECQLTGAALKTDWFDCAKRAYLGIQFDDEVEFASKLFRAMGYLANEAKPNTAQELRAALAKSWSQACSGRNIQNAQNFYLALLKQREIYASHPLHKIVRPGR